MFRVSGVRVQDFGPGGLMVQGSGFEVQEFHPGVFPLLFPVGFRFWANPESN